MQNRLILAVAVLAACSSARSSSDTTAANDSESRHLSNVHRLTNGGENAEAYFSPDGSKLIFQSTRDGRTCDAATGCCTASLP